MSGKNLDAFLAQKDSRYVGPCVSQIPSCLDPESTHLGGLACTWTWSGTANWPVCHEAFETGSSPNEVQAL